MSNINRLHLTVSGGYMYLAKVDYKLPGKKEWKRSGNLGTVSAGFSKDVNLEKVSGIVDGAAVKFVMDIVGGKTVVATEIFTYRKNSECCASYNGTGTTFIGAKANFKGLTKTLVYSGEASAFFLKVTGLYAFNTKVQYRKPNATEWKTTGHVANVTMGIPEMVHISEMKGISEGDHFRFVMDVAAGTGNVVANEYFVYKKDITKIANYTCKGTVRQATIKYDGITAYSPADFNCDGLDRSKCFRNYSIHSANTTGLLPDKCVRIKGQALSDVMKFKNDGRIASIVSEKKGGKTRITSYASGPDNTGIGHIWFMDKDYNAYEEDVFLHGDRSKSQTTDYNSKNPNITYISWNDKPLAGDPILKKITVEGKYPKFFEALGFESVEEDGKFFYHTMVDCIQKQFGYCDLYDEVFDFATTMKREKFEFTSGGRRYIFWAWKGHYLNLDAGAEMGFYRYKGRYGFEQMKNMVFDAIHVFFKEYKKYLFVRGIVIPFTEEAAKDAVLVAMNLCKKSYYDFYEAVDRDLFLPMKLTLRGKGRLPSKIHTYAPNDKQWWITTFAPYLQGVNPKDLVPEYTIEFKGFERLFDDFVKAHSKSDWKFDKNKLTAEYKFDS